VIRRVLSPSAMEGRDYNGSPIPVKSSFSLWCEEISLTWRIGKAFFPCRYIPHNLSVGSGKMRKLCMEAHFLLDVRDSAGDNSGWIHARPCVLPGQIGGRVVALRCVSLKGDQKNC